MRHVSAAAAAVALIGLAAPVPALAGNGDHCTASACQVYNEPNGPTAGGHQQQTGPNTAGGGGTATTPKGLSRVLAQAGADKVPLSNLLTGSGGSLSAADGGGSPGLLGAVFDLGTGPLVLLAILLATAIGLAARGGLRGRLSRRSGD